MRQAWERLKQADCQNVAVGIVENARLRMENVQLREMLTKAIQVIALGDELAKEVQRLVRPLMGEDVNHVD